MNDPSLNYCGSLLSLSGNSMMLSDVSAETDAGSGATGMAWGNSIQNPTRWHIRVTNREKYPRFGPVCFDVVSVVLADLANFLVRIEQS